MNKPQEFRVILRVTTDPSASKKPVTEKGIQRILKNAINVSDIIETVSFGDVMEITKEKK